MIKKGKKELWGEICHDVKKGGFNLIEGVPSREISKKVLRGIRIEMLKLVFSDNWMGYSPSEGDRELRELVASKIKFRTDEVLITAGSQQAIAILFSTLAKNRKVVVEKYSYIGIEKVGEQLTEGIVGLKNSLNETKDTDLERQIKKIRPGIFYVVADFSNPTGDCISEHKRRLLVRLAHRYNFWIVEDQTYRELFFKTKDLKKSMSTMSNRVAVIGSVSKIMFPGIRVGWLGIRDKNIYQQLVNVKNGFDLSCGTWNQIVAGIFIKKINGGWKILDILRKTYSMRVKKLIEELSRNKDSKKYFDYKVIPKGGYYFWLKLTKPENLSNFVKLLREMNVYVASGQIFNYGKDSSDGVRLSIANVSEDKVKVVVERLLKAAAAVNN